MGRPPQRLPPRGAGASPLYCLSPSSAPATDANANAHAVDAVNANSVDSTIGDCGTNRLLRKRDLCDRLPISCPRRKALSLSTYEDRSALYNKWVEDMTLKE